MLRTGEDLSQDGDISSIAFARVQFAAERKQLTKRGDLTELGSVERNPSGRPFPARDINQRVDRAEVVKDQRLVHSRRGGDHSHRSDTSERAPRLFERSLRRSQLPHARVTISERFRSNVLPIGSAAAREGGGE